MGLMLLILHCRFVSVLIFGLMDEVSGVSSSGYGFFSSR